VREGVAGLDDEGGRITWLHCLTERETRDGTYPIPTDADPNR